MKTLIEGRELRMRSIRNVVVRAAVLALALTALGATPAAGADSDTLQAENGSNLWLVELKGSAASFRGEAKKAGVKYSERFAFSELWNGVSIVADAAQVGTIEALPSVAAVYPNQTFSIPAYQPDLNFAGGLTGADLVKSDLGFDGSGIRVAVMDTGIDYDHPDLGGCFGAGCRVTNGWDFVGDAYNASAAGVPISPIPNPDPNPDDCNGHGSHVAGIVGANGRIDGVAPGVTFGAYRVFGCEGDTTSDIMIAAMERVLRDNMDVLNMSIGDANNNWPDTPTAKAASRLAERGVKVVASIGNSGPVNLYSAGAPGVGEKVIGVASFDNSRAEMYALRVGGVLHPWGPASGSPGVPPLSGTFDLVRTGTQTTANDACGAPLPGPPAGLFDIATLPSMTGKVALIRRGTCGFYHKALAAQRAGAAAVILYNNQAGRLSPTVAIVAPHTEPVTIPVVFISQASGNAIDTLLAGGPQQVTWTSEFASEAVPTVGTASSFTSWGLAADLSVKPDIGAPGGNILSTYPLAKNGYANISGTSMASPHVAGAVALLLEAKGKTLDAVTVRTILQNSADPKPLFGFPTIPDAVHRQGAGMLDIDDAIQATTLVSPGKLSLGEGLGGTRTLTIQNSSSSAKTYSLSHLGAAATSNNTFVGGAVPAACFVGDVQCVVGHGARRWFGDGRRDDHAERRSHRPEHVRRLRRPRRLGREPVQRPVRGLQGRLPVDPDPDGPVRARPSGRAGVVRHRPGRERVHAPERRPDPEHPRPLPPSGEADGGRGPECGRRRRCIRCSRTGWSRTTCRGTARRPASSRSRGTGTGATTTAAATATTGRPFRMGRTPSPSSS